MKTVTVVFKDGGFKAGEFARLEKMIIKTLREKLPDVIIRVERSQVAWDPLITRVSGYWVEDSEPVLRQAHPIIMDIWRKGEWREGFNVIEVFVSPPPVEPVEVPVTVEAEKISTTEQGEIDG